MLRSCCVLAWLSGVISAGGVAGSENCIPNSSFEASSGSAPSGWSRQRWGGEGRHGYEKVGRTGGRCVSLSSRSGADIGWQVTVPVKPFSVYRLTGWIKTENVAATTGRGALLNLHDMQPLATEAVTGTKPWRCVELVFETGSQDSVSVNCLFGGWGLATGKAYYDDISLELVETRRIKPSVVIDTTSQREALPLYIYGQFIEHLGRCIYGGIWAEMLQDRKFFHAVGATNSPWRVVGKGTQVRMVTEGAYVGGHSPEVTCSGSFGGLLQEGLALGEGKGYAGRVVVAGSTGLEALVVRLLWGRGEKERSEVRFPLPQTRYVTKHFRFTAGGSTHNGALQIVGLRRSGAPRASFRIGAVSLMPEDNVHGMRPDTLRCLRELAAPIYRWPGGNFVSGYNWKDGIGDPDRRPPRKNPAWRGVEHNDFGFVEFMTFCRTVGAEPLVVVNSGLGTATMAEEEVQFANGSTQTPMGRVRASLGRPEPFKVTWWGIGNEMYGRWQLGHMPLEKYVVKHNEFARVMRRQDRSVKLVGVGAVGRWSEQMLRHCAGSMDLISEHFYCGERKGILSHVAQIPAAIRRKAEAHRRYRKTIIQLKGKDIRIAMDEWNYWYGRHLYGELGTRYFLKDALGIAAGLNEYSRNTDIIAMANYAQTVNVIGCIKTTKTHAAFATTGLVLKLYRHHFGRIPVAVQGTPGPLDVAASLTEDRQSLTVAVVNPLRHAATLAVEVKGAKLAVEGSAWIISHSDPMVYNEPGREPQVRIRPQPAKWRGRSLRVDPLSVTLFAFPIRKGGRP